VRKTNGTTKGRALAYTFDTIGSDFDMILSVLTRGCTQTTPHASGISGVPWWTVVLLRETGLLSGRLRDTTLAMPTEKGRLQMNRRTYTTPLLIGMLALAGCPDDVPADTEGTSTGDTTGNTTVEPTTTPMTTTIDPDSTTTVDPDSTSVGEVCEPACGAGECCVGGFCFDEPAPSCAAACGTFEQCLCPEGSDPCDCEASCVVCGVEDGTYDPCIDVMCPAGSFCVVDDPDEPTFGWCAQQGCGEDDCACPLPADAAATALPTCGGFAGDEGNGSCFLDCSADSAVCPEGMLCRTLEGESACVWPGEGIVSDCCIANGATGCDNDMCEMTVCDADAYCCDTEWDDICVGEAQQLCEGLCPIENAQPQYGDCINVGDCDLGLTCVSDTEGTFGWCGTLDCADDTECQPPPATGDAPAACIDVNGMGFIACALDCSMGQTCPDGMTCFSDFVCVWAEAVPAYGDCLNDPGSCSLSEDVCIDDGAPMPGAGACSESGCMDATECPVAPATGDAVVSCGDLGDGNTCYLDCSMGETCPDGMGCTDLGTAMACLWPIEVVLLEEDFEGGALPMGWTVIDVDGHTPDMNVSFVDDAWVVADEFEPGMNFGAYSTSWYAPAGQSDDWLITPQITLGSSTEVDWEGWAPDQNFPDGYELRISTGMPTVVDFMANPALFTIADEGDPFTEHTVDLAAAGYMNQDVYLAWRNNSNDEFILVIDNVRVAD